MSSYRCGVCSISLFQFRTPLGDEFRETIPVVAAVHAAVDGRFRK